MNDIASAARDLKLGWEQRVGAHSEFDGHLTPESRQFSRLMINEPCAAADAILNGIGISWANNRPDPKVSIKLRGIAIVALATTCTAIIAYLGCNYSHATWWTTVLVLGALTFTAVAGMCFLKSGLKKYISVEVSEPPTPQVIIDPRAITSALDAFQRMIENVVERVKYQEADRALVFDVSDSTSFGEWVQAFVDYANKYPENNDWRILKCSLVSQLRMKGIVVYDTLLKNPDGTQNVPDRDSFKDERPSDDSEYVRVCHAVVYSRRRVLALGELA
jgi:hypothetical protein